MRRVPKTNRFPYLQTGLHRYPKNTIIKMLNPFQRSWLPKIDDLYSSFLAGPQYV